MILREKKRLQVRLAKNMNNQWDNNYDYGSNQSQGFYDPSAYNYDAGAADYSVSNPVADGMFEFSKLLTCLWHKENETTNSLI